MFNDIMDSYTKVGLKAWLLFRSDVGQCIHSASRGFNPDTQSHFPEPSFLLNLSNTSL